MRTVLNRVITAVVFAALLFLLYAVFRLWVLDQAERNNRRTYQEIQQHVTVLPPEQILCLPVTESTEIMPEYQELAEEYPNFAGWISIYGTDLSLPVMQEQEDNQNYYLAHDYKGDVSEFGCPYIPYNCSYDSENVIIYGHNMRHEQMFGLLQMYQNPSFWEEHRLINYDTPYQHKVYEVFSVMIVSTEDRHFRFQGYTGFLSPSQTHFYINECVERSLYDTDIVPDDDSRLLTLVTCEYSLPDGNGRLVIVARDITYYG